MALKTTYSDLDLCRKILLRTEEVMGSDRPKGPDNYHFEGYSHEMVEFNLRKLHDYGAISVRERIERYRGVLNYWPVLLYDKGLAFIEDARNDEVWDRALEQIEERGVQPTLKRVRAILLEIEREGHLVASYDQISFLQRKLTETVKAQERTYDLQDIEGRSVCRGHLKKNSSRVSRDCVRAVWGSWEHEIVLYGSPDRNKSKLCLVKIHSAMQELPRTRAICVCRSREHLSDLSVGVMLELVCRNDYESLEISTLGPKESIEAVIYANGSELLFRAMSDGAHVFGGRYHLGFVSRADEFTESQWNFLVSRVHRCAQGEPSSQILATASIVGPEHWILHRNSLKRIAVS